MADNNTPKNDAAGKFQAMREDLHKRRLEENRTTKKPTEPVDSLDNISYLMENIDVNIQDLVVGTLGNAIGSFTQIDLDQERTDILSDILDTNKDTLNQNETMALILDKMSMSHEDLLKLSEEAEEKKKRQDNFGTHENGKRGPSAISQQLDKMSLNIDDPMGILQNAGIGLVLAAFIKGAFEEIFSTDINIRDIIDIGRIKGTINLIRASFKDMLAPVSKFAALMSGAASKWVKIPIVIEKTFKPIIGFTKSISAFAKSGAFNTLRVLGNLTATGKFLTLLGKFAWPISIIFSAFDAINKFQETEGNFIEKSLSGIGAFMASIIGAPLDLLKNAVGFIVGKLGWEDAQEKIQQFSFSDIIQNMFDNIYGLVTGAMSWVKGLFKDPREAIAALWNSDFGVGKPASILYSSFLAPIGTWLKEMFNNPKQVLMDSFSDILKGYVNVAGWVVGTFIDPVIGWFRKMFGWQKPDEDFSLIQYMKDEVLAPAIGWFKGVMANPVEALKAGLVTLFDGYVNIATWMMDKMLSPVLSWVGKLFGWVEPEEDFVLTKFLSGIAGKIETWFTDKFGWIIPSVSETWDNLGTLVSNSWDSAAAWFTGMLTWSSDKIDSMSNFLSDIFYSTIKDIEIWFKELFNFLPSIDEIKDSLLGLRPDWMKPAEVTDQDKLERLQSQLKIQEDLLRQYNSKSPLMRGASIDPTAEIERLKADIRKLESGSGVVDMTRPVSVGEIQQLQNDRSLQRKVDMIEEYSKKREGASMPVIVKGGSTSSNPTYNSRGGDTITNITNVNDPERELNYIPR